MNQQSIATMKEPWRCGGCKRLMYNLDAHGYPAAGAPIPRYLDDAFPAVCSVCFEMHRALSTIQSDYWKEPVPEMKRRIVRADVGTSHC